MHTTASPPIFVVGSARSGTTLLYSILLASGEFVIYQAETLLLEVCKPKYGDLRNNRNYERFINDWLRSKQFYRSGLDPVKFVAGARDHRQSYIAFMEYFMECIADSQNKKRWAEQTPGHVFHMDELSQFFPQAKFVHVIRDGRDVAVSRRKLKWTGTKTTDALRQLLCAAKSWELSVEAGRRIGKFLGNNYLEIRYEDLIQHLDETLLKIRDFAGITIDRKTIQYSSVGSLGKANSAFDNQSSGISSSALGRWQKELNEGEINILHSAIGNTLTKLGYEANNRVRTVISWKNRLYLLWCPIFLKAKAYFKNKTFFGRLTSDTIEIGMK